MPVLIAALSALPASAAKVEVDTSLLVGETYTDNVRLAPSQAAQDDWVTQVIPGISVAAMGTGLTLSGYYRPELLYFAQDDRAGEIFHRGRVDGSAELAPEFLFVDMGAHIDQYDASLQSPLTSSNTNLTGNRTSVSTFFISPYASKSFGTAAKAEVRFTASLVDSQESELSSREVSSLTDSTSEKLDLHIESGPQFKKLSWAFNYLNETIEYKDAEDAFTEIVAVTAKQMITSYIGLRAGIGYERYDFDVTGIASEGPSWFTGVEWTPSPVTRGSVTFGHRFFGDTYGAELAHRTRLTAWNFFYSQSVTTSRSEFFVAPTTDTTGYLDTLFSIQYSDPEARSRAVNDFIGRTGISTGLNAPLNVFTSDLLLVKRWQASGGILGARNVVIANVFKETSESLTGSSGLSATGDFASSNTVEQTGVGVLWNLRLAPRVAWNVKSAYSENQFPSLNRTDHLTFLGLGLTRQLQSRTYGSLNYRLQRRESSAVEADYLENAVFATIQTRF